MFAKSVVLADAFLEMPHSAKILYFFMGMTADDDGFVNNPRSLMRQVGAKPKDLQLLETLGYLYTFPSGVALIRHWKVHNLIRNDRYRHTACLKEYQQVKCQGGVYRLTDGLPDDNQLGDSGETQDRIGKVREGKVTPPVPPAGDVCEKVIGIYHDICGALPPCTEVTGARRRAIRRCVEDGMALEDFEALFRRAAGSKFLCGGGERGFIAGLDWLLQKNNRLRVLEGCYDDRSGKSAVPMGAGELGAAELEAIQRLMKEEN